MGSNGVWCAKYLAFGTFSTSDTNALIRMNICLSYRKKKNEYAFQAFLFLFFMRAFQAIVISICPWWSHYVGSICLYLYNYLICKLNWFSKKKIIIIIINCKLSCVFLVHLTNLTNTVYWFSKKEKNIDKFFLSN